MAGSGEAPVRVSAGARQEGAGQDGAGQDGAGQEGVDRAVEILAGAFYSDPLWSWAFPDGRRRYDQHSVLWRLFVEGAVRHSWVWLDAARAATSVWIPPGAAELSPDQEAGFEALVREQAGPDADRVLGAFDLLEQAHPHAEPHFYLSLLGTAPDRRGHGYGLALLAANLRLIDGLGAPAYLEASNLANVPLYARHGFAPVGRVRFPGGGPEVVTMWRDGKTPRYSPICDDLSARSVQSEP